MKVGFVGLGVMGLPMARHLVEAGFTVSGFARSEEAARAAAAAGVEVRPKLAELAAGNEVLVTMVTTSADVLDVATREGGLYSSAEAGTVHADMSTIAPDASRRLEAAARERGVQFLDAPVSGGSTGAEEGTLTIMVGGDPAVLERCRPVFAAVGDPGRIFHCGPVGSGKSSSSATTFSWAPSPRPPSRRWWSGSRPASASKRWSR